jgi:hypothetical protein
MDDITFLFENSEDMKKELKSSLTTMQDLVLYAHINRKEIKVRSHSHPKQDQHSTHSHRNNPALFTSQMVCPCRSLVGSRTSYLQSRMTL